MAYTARPVRWARRGQLLRAAGGVYSILCVCSFHGALTRTNLISNLWEIRHKGLVMTAKRLFLYAFASLALLLTAHSLDLRSQSANSSSPPVAPVRPVTDEYFGIKVVDPYRYMENLKDPEVQAWFKAEDDYTRAVLATIPGRRQLLDRIEQLDQSAPYHVSNVQRYEGERYYYQKMLASEEVSKLYERDGLNGNEKLLVDPGKFVTLSGTHYSLDYYVPSYDGHYVAYGVSPGGSEDAVIHILDISSARDTGETIDRSWYGGISWLPDNRSFFHIRFQKLGPGADPNERRLKSRVYLHRVGTDPESDPVVFGYDVDPNIKLEPSDASFVMSDPHTTLAIAGLQHGFRNELTLHVAPVDSVGNPGTHWRKLCDTRIRRILLFRKGPRGPSNAGEKVLMVL